MNLTTDSEEQIERDNDNDSSSDSTEESQLDEDVEDESFIRFDSYFSEVGDATRSLLAAFMNRSPSLRDELMSRQTRQDTFARIKWGGGATRRLHHNSCNLAALLYLRQTGLCAVRQTDSRRCFATSRAAPVGGEGRTNDKQENPGKPTAQSPARSVAQSVTQSAAATLTEPFGIAAQSDKKSGKKRSFHEFLASDSSLSSLSLSNASASSLPRNDRNDCNDEDGKKIEEEEEDKKRAALPGEGDGDCAMRPGKRQKDETLREDEETPLHNEKSSSSSAMSSSAMSSSAMSSSIASSFPPTSCWWGFKSAVQSALWSVQRLSLVDEITAAHRSCVNALCFSPGSGQWLASGSDDLHIAISDWMNTGCDDVIRRSSSGSGNSSGGGGGGGKNVACRFRVGHKSNIFCVRFLDCATLPANPALQLVSCANDCQVIYSVVDNSGSLRSTRRLALHRSPCHKLETPPHEPHLVLSAGNDCRVLQSDVREANSGQCLFEVNNVPLYSIACNPARPTEICLAGKDKFVRVVDRRFIPNLGHHTISQFSRQRDPCLVGCFSHDISRTQSSRLTNQLASIAALHVTSATYSHDGKYILASYNDENVYLFDAQNDKEAPLHKYAGHRNFSTVKGVSFYGSRSEYVMSGSDNGYAYIWERESEGIVQWLRADQMGIVNNLVAHPNLPVIAASGLDSTIKIFAPNLDVEITQSVAEQMTSSETVRREVKAPFDPRVKLALPIWRRRQRQQQRHEKEMESAGEEKELQPRASCRYSPFDQNAYAINSAINFNQREHNTTSDLNLRSFFNSDDDTDDDDDDDDDGDDEQDSDDEDDDDGNSDSS